MRMQRRELNNSPMCLENGSIPRSNIVQLKSSNRPLRAHHCDLTFAFTLKRNHRCYQLTWQGATPSTPKEQQESKMPSLKLQFNYILTKNILFSYIQQCRAILDVVFYSDHPPVFGLTGLKDDECRKKFRQRVSSNIALRTKEGADGVFTKCTKDVSNPFPVPGSGTEKNFLLYYRRQSPRTILYA
ncbi:hypothetical protein RB195_000675 [Necator americanus]|uniref:Uncharacterized protein n=1 Tax=Necator americanus TaxID=51031 RepID=A0ABR1DAU2_NECAM